MIGIRARQRALMRGIGRASALEEQVRLGGSPMSLKGAWRFVLRLTALLAAADSERCPALSWRRAHPDGTRTAGQSLPQGPRRGTSGTVAPPARVGHRGLCPEQEPYDRERAGFRDLASNGRTTRCSEPARRSRLPLLESVPRRAGR